MILYPPLEPLRDDIPFRRALAAGRGFGVFYGGEVLFQQAEQHGIGAAGQHLGDKCPAIGQIADGEICRGFHQAHGAQMVGLLVADGVGGHVGEDEVWRAA